MTDQRLDIIIGNLLRIGVTIAALVVLAGGIWYLASPTLPPSHYMHFAPTVRGVRSISALSPPRAVILAGLLILIATPVARVLFSLIAFALEGDRLYVVATLIVLLVLLYSIGTSWL